MLNPICSTDFYPLHQMNTVSLLESHQNIGYLLVKKPRKRIKISIFFLRFFSKLSFVQLDQAKI